MGDDALDAVKPRLADSCRSAAYDGFRNAADAVGFFARFQNALRHFLAARIVEHGEAFCVERFYIAFNVAELSVRNAGALCDVRCKAYAYALERRDDNAACRNERRGYPAGKMSAAAIVLKAVILAVGRKIGMRRTRRAVVIVAASGVLVWDDYGQRSAGRSAAKHAAYDLKLVLFLPGRIQRRGRAAARELSRDEVLIYLYSRCESVYHASDRRTVAFAEYRQANALTEAVFHP